MKYITRLCFLFLVFISVLCFGVSNAEAHVLRTDGTIGAIMHIDPDDDPIAGQQSAFFFELKDTTDKFDPINCTCTLQILENGKLLSEQPLFQNSTTPSLTNASAVFTFPKRDLYVVRVIGKPLQQGLFTPFTLSYDVRVARAANTKPTSPILDWIATNTVHLIGAIIIALFFVILLMTQHKRQKETHEQTHHHHSE